MYAREATEMKEILKNGNEPDLVVMYFLLTFVLYNSIIS